MEFESTPLLTPERIAADPKRAFEVRPAWASLVHLEGLEDNDAPVAFVVIGHKHPVVLALSTPGFALFCEITRLGHNITTNSNFGKPIPIIYGKVTFDGAQKDDITLGRAIAGAEANEAVKALELTSDLRPENLYRIGAGKPKKAARDLVLRHCLRLAREREAAGSLPEGFDLKAYINNIERLFAAIDAELGALVNGV
jgi:hypothetical protein